MSDITDYDCWDFADDRDLWVFDKFIVARRSGYVCGTIGSAVPEPNWYCIRPAINQQGMGVMARKLWINDTKETFKLLYPGEFWCEWFEGEHLSIDYREGQPCLSVVGHRTNNDIELFRFIKWEKVDYAYPLPEICQELIGEYEVINCEFIGGKLIEVHLRENPDFIYGNDYMIPVWEDLQFPVNEGETYIPDGDDGHDIRAGRIIGSYQQKVAAPKKWQLTICTDPLTL